MVWSLLYLVLWSDSLLLFLRLESLLRFWVDFLIKTDYNSQCREVQWAGKEASLSPRIPFHLQSAPQTINSSGFQSSRFTPKCKASFSQPFPLGKVSPTLPQGSELRPRTGHGATLPDLCGLGTLRRGGMPATR